MTTTPMTALRLFNLNDDGDGDLLDDEITWRAIWAPSRTAAESMFRDWYERETGVKSGEYSIGGDRDPNPKLEPDIMKFAPMEPGHERRSEVLRLVGWSCEGDWRCDSCGLAEMDGDDEAWHVCRECNQCGECGHDDDCPGDIGGNSAP